MTEPSQPTKKDTAPPEFRELADAWLERQAHLGNDFSAFLDEMLEPNQCIPIAWAGALASEIDEVVGEWVETLIAGRPYDTPLVEWEHRELDDRPQDAAEMRAEMTR